MGSLNWEDAPPTAPAKAHREAATHVPKGILGFIVTVMSGAAFSLLLMGLIAGYILGKVLH